MSSNDVLGIDVPADAVGSMKDLATKLASEEGALWLSSLKRLLRGEAIEAKAARAPDVLRWRTISDTAIEVNFDAPVILPFTGAKVEAWVVGLSGWVRVELRDGVLYVGGREVLLHLDDAQKAGTIRGHELRQKLAGKAVLHPNILDALFENQHLIPESWKQDEQGRTRYIFFWAVGFRGGSSRSYVRCLYWDVGRWNRYCSWLDYDWGVQDPAAVAAS